MKVTFTTKSSTKALDEIERRAKALRQRKAYVKVGLLGRSAARTGGLTNPELGSIHEYGTSTVPARPFLGPPFRERRAEYIKLLAKAFARSVLDASPESFRRTLALLGQKITADTKAGIVSGGGIPPPLSPKTVKAKGSSRPLVDTGQLLRAITYEVVE